MAAHPPCEGSQGADTRGDTGREAFPGTHIISFRKTNVQAAHRITIRLSPGMQYSLDTAIRDWLKSHKPAKLVE